MGCLKSQPFYSARVEPYLAHICTAARSGAGDRGGAQQARSAPQDGCGDGRVGVDPPGQGCASADAEE
eukprot:7394516-Pyramimonas_sp.AAC.1